MAVDGGSLRGSRVDKCTGGQELQRSQTEARLCVVLGGKLIDVARL